MNRNDNKAYKCIGCGRVHFPKRTVCLSCNSRDFEEIPMGGEASIVTFSNIYQLPWGINVRYLTIGVAQFDNGAKAMGRISSPDVKIGDRVKAVWKIFRQMAGEDVYGWVFEPIK